MSAAAAGPVGPVRGAVQRWTRVSAGFTTGFAGLIAAMALVPVALSGNAVQEMTTLLTFVLMAVMWNALAGYGGLVSVGLQAYIGLGAYATVWLANRGVSPYLAMVIATLFCGAVSLPLSFLVLRFRGAQFAIGTWVVAEALGIYVSFDSSLGAGTGTSLTQLDAYSQGSRQNYTYWLTLAMTVFFVGLLFVLLRSRLGSSLQAIRDDEEAAASVGVRVVAVKRILFVVAGLGCGAAGALTLANILFIEPTSIFSVNYSAYMIFMVLVGGLGTFEGPIIGAIIFYVIQNQFSSNGTWYLVALGATAIAFALFLPRGLWGELEARSGLRFMPLGYRLRAARASGEGGPPP